MTWVGEGIGVDKRPQEEGIEGREEVSEVSSWMIQAAAPAEN